MEITRHNPGPRMSQAVEHNGVVYLAGQVADDRNSDITEQTSQVLAKIDALLATAGERVPIEVLLRWGPGAGWVKLTERL